MGQAQAGSVRWTTQDLFTRSIEPPSSTPAHQPSGPIGPLLLNRARVTAKWVLSVSCHLGPPFFFLFYLFLRLLSPRRAAVERGRPCGHVCHRGWHPRVPRSYPPSALPTMPYKEHHRGRTQTLANPGDSSPLLPPLTWEERRRGRRRGRPFVESAMKLEAVRGGGAERRQAVRALRRFDLCFLCSELGLPLHVFTTAYSL
jgi:hypothetical protein